MMAHDNEHFWVYKELSPIRSCYGNHTTGKCQKSRINTNMLVFRCFNLHPYFYFYPVSIATWVEKTRMVRFSFSAVKNIKCFGTIIGNFILLGN